MSGVIPLDKEAAVGHVIERSRSHWRITVVHHINGSPYRYKRPERDRYQAIAEALREFEALHPECTAYGETHGISRVEELEPAAVAEDEIEGAPA